MTNESDLAQEVLNEIDEALEEDNLETRQGVKFTLKVLRAAMKEIAEAHTARMSTITRLGNVENGLNQFLQAQEKKEKSANEERQRWRWAILGPVIIISLNEVLSLIKSFFEWMSR